jgi:hypothetical protein
MTSKNGKKKKKTEKCLNVISISRAHAVAWFVVEVELVG